MSNNQSLTIQGISIIVKDLSYCEFMTSDSNITFHVQPSTSKSECRDNIETKKRDLSVRYETPSLFRKMQIKNGQKGGEKNQKN